MRMALPTVKQAPYFGSRASSTTTCQNTRLLRALIERASRLDASTRPDSDTRLRRRGAVHRLRVVPRVAAAEPLQLAAGCSRWTGGRGCAVGSSSVGYFAARIRRHAENAADDRVLHVDRFPRQRGIVAPRRHCDAAVPHACHHRRDVAKRYWDRLGIDAWATRDLRCALRATDARRRTSDGPRLRTAI